MSLQITFEVDSAAHYAALEHLKVEKIGLNVFLPMEDAQDSSTKAATAAKER